MKKIIYTSMLLIIISGACNATITEMAEPVEHEQPGLEPQEKMKEQEAEKQKIEAQKQGEINNLNRLFGQLKGKGARDRAAINSEIQKITGSDVQLDPSNKDFQEEKKRLQQSTIDKYNERIEKISEQIKKAQETTSTIADDFNSSFSDSDNGLSDSDNGLSENDEPSLSQTDVNHMIKSYEEMSQGFEQALTDPEILINQLDNNPGFLNEVNHLSNPSAKETADLKNFLKRSPDSQKIIDKAQKNADVLNAINEVRTSLEKIAQDPKNEVAFAERNSAVRKLEELTGIPIAGNNGVVENLRNLNQNNLQDVYQKIADSYKEQEEAKEEPATKKEDAKSQEARLSKTELEAQKQALNQALSIVDDLKSLGSLSDEETKNLDQKANDAKEALDQGIGSKIIKAINDFIALLKSLLDKLMSNTLGTDYADAKELMELQNRLKNLSKKLNSVSAKQQELAVQNPHLNPQI